jgi:hypothetical protein
MPIFGTTGPEYDKNKAKAKELKKGSKEDRKERRKIKRMNRKERENVLNAAAKGKISTIIDTTGKIIGINAIKAVPEFKRRLQKGKCPICGTTPERRGYICNDCKSEVSQFPSAHEINNTHFTDGRTKGIPAGQNANGIVYCKNNHRIWDNGDCHQGCVAAANK